MSADGQKMQADGSGTHARMPDENGELASRRGEGGQAGESGGGPYPNPHDPAEDTGKDHGGFLGHGGQTEIAYHGPGQLGTQTTGETGNAPTKEE